jgi:hypothetical protein
MVDKRHPYEVDKKNYTEGLWMRNNQMVKTAYKVHPHTMKQKQFLCQTGFMSQHLSNSHCYVTWVDFLNILETVVVRCTQA